MKHLAFSLLHHLPLCFLLSLLQMVKLQACIKYCEEDYSASKVTSFYKHKLYSFWEVRFEFSTNCTSTYAFVQSLLEQLPQDEPDYVYNMGCLMYQDGKYEEACKKFMSAMQVLGYVPGIEKITHGSEEKHCNFNGCLIIELE